MQINNIQLSSKDILDKQFKTTMRGYHQIEVDEFLDVIIQDYESFHEQIDQLNKEIARLKKQVEDSRTRPSQVPNQQVNYDVLKRLSNLEKEVFGKKFINE